eukprot:3684210-Alexandrium_andersonii.AAC.1
MPQDRLMQCCALDASTRSRGTPATSPRASSRSAVPTRPRTASGSATATGPRTASCDAAPPS